MNSQAPFCSESSVNRLAHQIREEFQRWRASCGKGKRRIPEHLWQAAIELAARSTISRAAHWLGLECAALKERTKVSRPSDSRNMRVAQREGQTTGSQDQKRHQPPLRDGFVETVFSSASPPPLAEIQWPDGPLLRLFSLDAAPFIRWFLPS